MSEKKESLESVSKLMNFEISDIFFLQIGEKVDSIGKQLTIIEESR